MKRALKRPLWSMVVYALGAFVLSRLGASVFGRAAFSIAFGVIGGSAGAAIRTELWRGRKKRSVESPDSDSNTIFLRLAKALLPGELRTSSSQVWKSEHTAIRAEGGKFAALRFSTGLVRAAFSISLEHWRFYPAHSLAGTVPPPLVSALSNQKRRSFGYRLARIAACVFLLRLASAVLHIGFWTYLGWLGIAVLGTYLYETLRGRQ
jgi:hypothetical protein